MRQVGGISSLTCDVEPLFPVRLARCPIGKHLDVDGLGEWNVAQRQSEVEI
jgi:hypothetical protein